MPVVELKNPLGNIVQKIAVVRHRDDRAFVTREMLLQPLHTLGVEMVGRLVKKENIRFLQKQTRQRDATALATGKMIHHLIARRTTQRVHRHLDLRTHVPSAERVDLLLELRLLVRNRVFRCVVNRLGEFVPCRVVSGGEIGEMFHALVHTLAHGFAGGELRLLFEKAHGVARLEMNSPIKLLVAPGENAHERGLAGAIESEHADLRSVVKRQRNVAEDFLALDFLRDAHHRENDLGFVGLGHGEERLGFCHSFKPREKSQRLVA